MRLPRRGAAAAVAVAAVALTECTGGDSGIQVAAVGRSTVTEVVEAPATVQARASTTLTSPATGEVAELFVKDGERVGEGTLIARISSPETTARLTQTRAALVQAEASAPGAPAYLSSGPLADADSSAQGAFDGARKAAQQIPDQRLRAAALAQVAAAERQYALAAAQVRSAVAAVNSGIGNLSAALASLTAAQRVQAQVAVDAAQKAVDALDVRAPIAGSVQLGGSTAGTGTGSAGGTGSALDSVLGQLPADVQQQASSALGGAAATGGGPAVRTIGPVTEGMPVSTGTPLATIVDNSVLSLVAEVDETDVFLVRPGVKAVAELDAVPGAQYAATVAAVDLSPTPSARGGVSYRVRLSLAGGTLPDGNPAPKPRPGMSAVADLRVRTARDAVTVPASAVIRDGARDAVWVQVGRVARKRLVTVGTQGEDAVEIRAGVREGERVVVRGADRVREGQELP